MGGCRWLVDAGTCSYMSEDRDLFRSTGAHNTLRVDGADQAIAAGPFAWASIPSVHTEIWMQGETFNLFAGSHSGYARLPDPVRHQRWVFHLHGRFWLVRDVAEGKGLHKLETFWYFAPDLTVTNQQNLFIAAGSGATPEKPGMRLGLLPVEDSVWLTDLSSSFVSPAYGKKEPAPVVRCSARVRLPAEHAVVLRATSPFDSLGQLACVSTPDRAAHAYRYEESGKSHITIFAGREKDTWTCCGLTSDARFLYYCVEDGGLTHFILCRGKSAHLRGEPILALDRTTERFEWLTRQGQVRISSSDELAKNSWFRNALELFC